MPNKCTPHPGAKHISKSKCTTRGPDHLWKSRCRKSARRCGAKHILKSNVLKTGGLRPRLEVEMLKQCTPLWREAHFEVKRSKRLGVRTIVGGSDVEKVYAVVARSTLRSHTTLHYSTLHSSTLHDTKLHYPTLHYTDRRKFRSQTSDNMDR